MTLSSNNLVLLIAILLVQNSFSQEVISFKKLQDVWDFADKNSIVIQTNDKQQLIAKWTKIAAIGNTFNLRNPITFSMIDNTQLPVSFIPAETFGGPAGTFKEFKMGQQYITNFNFTPMLDIINPNAWAKVKSADINTRLTQVSTQLLKKSLYESISAAYYNIVMLHEQQKLVAKSIQNTDTILRIAQAKYNEGLVRKTDVNDASIAYENISEKYKQNQFQITQQENILRTLLDIPANAPLEVIPEQQIYETTASAAPVSSLQTKQFQLQYELAKAELNAAKLWHLPTVTLLSSFAWQQNGNKKFFDSNNKWIASNYVGFRVNVNFPPDINKIANQATAKYNADIAKFNLKHNEISNEVNNKQLFSDFEKSISQYKSTRKIQDFKDDNYTKILNLYKENLIGMDRLMAALNDKLNNELLLSSAAIQTLFSQTKININNSFK